MNKKDEIKNEYKDICLILLRLNKAKTLKEDVLLEYIEDYKDLLSTLEDRIKSLKTSILFKSLNEDSKLDYYVFNYYLSEYLSSRKYNLINSKIIQEAVNANQEELFNSLLDYYADVLNLLELSNGSKDLEFVFYVRNLLRS